MSMKKTPTAHILKSGIVGEMDGNSGERCNLGFLEPPDLAEHLEELHELKIVGDGDSEPYAISERTHKYCCGFCCEAFMVKSMTPEVWEMERFTDIEAHFLAVRSLN
jgi:hypothetical protein